MRTFMQAMANGRGRTMVAGAAGLALALAAGACGGGGDKGAGASAAATGSTTAAAPAATPATGGSAAATPAGGAGAGPTPGSPPAGATAQMVALGDSIFHGQAAGGTCFTCHGPDAKGTPLAPNLTDTQWATGDGSYSFIQQRVNTGMATPTPPYSAPMPPKGGANLSDAQVKAVAAYVYAISHKS